MLMPSIFADDFVDEFFGTPERYYVRANSASRMMQTDVKETDSAYEVCMDLPGVRKENVKCELKDGYLVVSAETNRDNDQKDSSGRYIRRERFSGTCSRSFYVGKELKQEDIKAKFADGVLTLVIPKEVKKPKIEDSNIIDIEG